ncbi:tetratricopeptide repeat-containing sensor histidine kinase [Niabella hirudinis]|uniref:tetratricopeptide repeat-containing sensor histidine kinase n=1 Tax=Niabella hirudinis TaxID=1285929 RepID=UPI003EBF2611
MTKSNNDFSQLLLLLLFLALAASCNSLRKERPLPSSADYEKGKSFYGKKNDSAFYYFNKVTASPGDSLLVAKAYTYQAIIQSGAGDPFGCQESLLQALKFLDEKKNSNWQTLSSVYNELGYSSADLRNFDAAIGYYDHALKLSNHSFRAVILNNKALAFQRQQRYSQALAIYRSILYKSQNNKIEYARILSNIARLKWLQDSSYPAAAELLTAMQIRKAGGDDTGLNASYAHLSDYYARLHSDSALIYADEMLGIAQKINSPGDELQALTRLMVLGSATAVKKYFLRFQFLNDSIQTARNNAKNQFILIRYEAEKNKAENLILQKENIEKKTRIIQLWAIISGVILFTLVFFIWYRKKKQRTIQEQRLKTSKKVHDIVANGIYNLMSKIEHDKTGGKESLLNEMADLYEQSRNISYESPETTTVPFHESIVALLSSFSAPDIRVSIVGHSKELWDRITPKAKKELRHVLQELMINMKKHSRAGNVVVRFEQQQTQLRIRYTDDGIGIPPGFTYGNGLKNTENRIKSIGGRLIFDTSVTQGLKLELCLPLT